MIKLIVLLLFLGLGGVGFYVYQTAPKYMDQSIVDKIANNGLKGYLNELGATETESVCWLGDPKSRILNQYLGAEMSIFDRLREKMRIKSWSVSHSCLDHEYKALVVLFPFLKDIYEVSEEESKKLQTDMSEILSLTGRAKGYVRHSVSFQLQDGANMIVLTKSPPEMQTVTNTK
jgi:hypothetical protein